MRFLPKSALSMAASIVVGIAAVGVAPGPAFAQVVNDPIAAVKNVAEQTSAAEMDVLGCGGKSSSRPNSPLCLRE